MVYEYVFSPRAIVNKVLALSVYSKDEGTLTYHEYFSTSPTLFTRLMSLPTEKITRSLYNLACDMWLSLASTTEDIDIIVNVTTTCLSRKIFLYNDQLFIFR